MKFNRAIVKTPSVSLHEGLTSVDLGIPDHDLARVQHQDYISALEECGLEVEILNADHYPDSTFVEDVALLTPNFAVITQPGAESRRGEIEAITPVISQYYSNLEFMSGDAYLEAGDVMMVDKHFYIGISERTNQKGASELIQILNNHGFTGSMVPLKKVLHLKTGLSYIENNNLLISGEFIDDEQFSEFNHLVVDENEAYATNSVWINGTVLVPHGFPKTLEMIQSAGYKTRGVDVSEFQKLDGGLSCLSLRF